MCRIDGDYERPQAYVTGRRKARLAHVCVECARVIARGETYWVTSGVWDGQPARYKHCEHCEVLCKWLTAQCGALVHGQVVGECEAHLRDYGMDHFEGLAECVEAAQRQWTRIDDATHNRVLMGVPEMPVTRFDD